MYRSLFMKFITLIITICLLIFIEYKFEVIDYLRFVNSAKTLKVDSGSDLIAYSPNGEMFAIAGGKRISSKINVNSYTQGYSQVEVRRVVDGSLVKSWKLFAAQSLAFSPDSSMIAAGSRGGKVSLWRISDGEMLYSFGDASKYFTTQLLAFTPDGNNLVGLIFTSNSPSKVTIWDLANQTNRVLSGEFVSAALSADGETIAVGYRNQAIDLYRLDDLTLVKQLEVNRKQFSLVFSPNGKQIAFISHSPPAPPEDRYGRNIYVYNVKDSILANIFYHSTIFPENEESLKKIAISPDGRYLAASYSRSTPSSFFVGAPRIVSDARFYGRIRVWRIEDGKQLSTFRGHKRRTTSIVFSPDSKFLVSTGWDGKVRFWKMPPRNYSWFWLFGATGLATLVYWQRASLML
ncbi:MAG: hypothetical protein Kow0049_07870 [Stanieria sp.]